MKRYEYLMDFVTKAISQFLHIVRFMQVKYINKFVQANGLPLRGLE